MKSHHGFLTAGTYDPQTHTMTVDKHTLGKNSVISHEERHALQRLLQMPSSLEWQYRVRKENWGKNRALARLTLSTLFGKEHAQRKFMEVSNPAFGAATGSTINAGGSIKRDLSFAAAVGLLAFDHPLLATFPLLYLREFIGHTQFRNLIHRHGEDGAILVYADPPTTAKGKITLRIAAWEKKMIQLGILEPNGGLTRKGLQYLRRKVQTQLIRERLAEMEKQRMKKDEERSST